MNLVRSRCCVNGISLRWKIDLFIWLSIRTLKTEQVKEALQGWLNTSKIKAPLFRLSDYRATMGLKSVLMIIWWVALSGRCWATHWTVWTGNKRTEAKSSLRILWQLLYLQVRKFDGKMAFAFLDGTRLNFLKKSQSERAGCCPHHYHKGRWRWDRFGWYSGWRNKTESL